MEKATTHNSGQAMVLFVIGIVALLGFAALAIDGGMVYSDRRHAQNASDASSLAGGGAIALSLENSHVTYGTWNCSSSEIQAAITVGEAAAQSRAQDNDYTLDLDVSDQHGVETDCGQENSGSYIEKYIDIRTEISRTTDTAFAHLIYPGELRNQVEAVTRVHPRAALALGYAVVALNPILDCNGNQNGVLFSGNSEVVVTGGGIFSNGCLSGNGNSLEVSVYGGSIVHTGELETNHPGTFSPSPDSGGGIGLPEFAIGYPTPNCSQVAHYGSPSTAFRNNASGHIPAGNYSKIKMNGPVTLEGGGLYCLYGDFDAGNNDLSIDESNGRAGVTIYMYAGDFITTGGGVVVLAAPPATPDPSPAIAGLLIYMRPENHGLIKLRGNSDSVYVGTIYAPGGRIDIAGAAGMPPGETAGFNTQLISQDLEIGGNAYVNVNFDESTVFQLPSSLELYK